MAANSGSGERATGKVACGRRIPIRSSDTRIRRKVPQLGCAEFSAENTGDGVIGPAIPDTTDRSTIPDL